MIPTDSGGDGSLLSRRCRFGRRERVARPVDNRLLHPASTPAHTGRTQPGRWHGYGPRRLGCVVNGKGMTP